MFSEEKSKKLPHNLESCIMQLQFDSVLPLSAYSAATTHAHTLTLSHSVTHTNTLIFSDGKESLLWWRQPLWINSEAPYSPETFTTSRLRSTALVARCAKGLQRAAWRRGIYQNSFLVKLNLRLLSSLSESTSFLFWHRINVPQANFSDI